MLNDINFGSWSLSSLMGAPVVVCTTHIQLSCPIAMIQRIIYIM